MKLPNFEKSAELNTLREKMGSELIPWKNHHSWSSFNPDEWRRLNDEGLDVPISEVEVADDFTLKVRGETIVIYIRDQHVFSKRGVDNDSGYRFHIADCHKLDIMRSKGKYDRYVVSKRKNGKFVVNRMRFGDLIEKGIEVPIPVCKLCLNKLNYKDYGHSSKNKKIDVWDNFNLIEFFDKYDTHFKQRPKYNENTSPLNEYPDNWDEISDAYRNSIGWTCEKCHLFLGEDKKFLHTHHLDGNKANTNPEKFKALCIRCHAKEPDHEHVKNSPHYNQFLSKYVR